MLQLEKELGNSAWICKKLASYQEISDNHFAFKYLAKYAVVRKVKKILIYFFIYFLLGGEGGGGGGGGRWIGK